MNGLQTTVQRPVYSKTITVPSKPASKTQKIVLTQHTTTFAQSAAYHQKTFFNSGAMGDKVTKSESERKSNISPKTSVSNNKHSSTNSRTLTVEHKESSQNKIAARKALDDRPIDDSPKGTIKTTDFDSSEPELKMQLIQCKYCNRKFTEERIIRHEEICKRASNMQRNKYDATKHRILGTDLEGYSPRTKGFNGEKGTAKKKRTAVQGDAPASVPNSSAATRKANVSSKAVRSSTVSKPPPSRRER